MHFFVEQVLDRAALYDHGVEPDDDKQPGAAAKESPAEAADAGQDPKATGDPDEGKD